MKFTLGIFSTGILSGAILFGRGGERILSQNPFLVYPLDSCSQMALFLFKMGFNFLSNGSNDHKNLEAHLLDYMPLC